MMQDRFEPNAPFIPLATYISNQTSWLLLCLSQQSDDCVAIAVFDQSQHTPHAARFVDPNLLGPDEVLDAAFALTDSVTTLSIAAPDRSQWSIADCQGSLNQARSISSRYQAVIQGFEVDDELRLRETRFYRTDDRRIAREVRPYKKFEDVGHVLELDVFSTAPSLPMPRESVASVFDSDCHCCPQKLFDEPLVKLLGRPPAPPSVLRSPRISGHGVLAF